MSCAGVAAGRISTYGIDVVAAAGRLSDIAPSTLDIDFDVRGSRGFRGLVVLDCPLILGAVDLTQVIDAGIRLSGLSSAHKRRNSSLVRIVLQTLARGRLSECRETFGKIHKFRSKLADPGQRVSHDTSRQVR